MENNLIICRICGNWMEKSDPLDSVFRLNCDECYKSRIEEIKTNWFVKKNVDLSTCDYCLNSFALEERLVPHECNLENIFKCTECGQLLESLKELLKHKKFVHVKISEVLDVQKCSKCNICGIKFPSVQALKPHILTHMDMKTITCKACNKKFSTYGSLNRHIVVHTGEKLYGCETCDMKFNQNSNLQKHILIHTGDKPYRCNICDKLFSCSSNLQSHTRVHTRATPYHCKICDQKFSWKNTFKKHNKIHN